MHAIYQYVIGLNGYGHHQPAGRIGLHLSPVDQRQVLLSRNDL